MKLQLDTKQTFITFEDHISSNTSSHKTISQKIDTYDQINQHFQQQNEGQKTIQEAREILGNEAEGLTDSQVKDLVNEIQYLVYTWIEEYEQKVFDGKTLKELLQINL